MRNQDEGWEEFTHTTETTAINSRELFERFREFQRLIDGISKKELIARRWVEKGDDDFALSALFFDLPLTKQRTLFRKSSKADENLLAIWQARSKSEAERRCATVEVPRFTELTRADLRNFAKLSVDP